jgi:membrane protein YqaA with SNARE-associated domain
MDSPKNKILIPSDSKMETERQRTATVSLPVLALQTGLTLVFLIGIVFGLGIFARQEVSGFAEEAVKYIGYPGLFLGMLLSDSLPAFIPPDAFLLFSIAANLEGFWVIFYCSMGSILGGSISYAIGKLLIPRFSLGRQIILKYEDQLVPMIRKYGVWAVVLSAMTPVPYSWMAYSVGSFRMPFRYFLFGSLFRIPRLGLYYYGMLWGWI